MNVKLRSTYTVMTTGMVMPGHVLVGSARVELLAEFHDVDLRLAQRRAHRRRRSGFAASICNFTCV
jgi:hypothetical protein